MPKKNQQQRKKHKNERQGRQHQHAVINPAPLLFKKRVTLSSVRGFIAVNALGYTTLVMNANGLSTSDQPTLRTIPQKGIWDQYAAMFEYYQVVGISLQFIPNRFQGDISTAGLDPTTVFPTISCISPEDVPIANNPELFYSYGNGRITPPYASHSRRIDDYTNLSILKQEETILRTRTPSGGREQYTRPASIQFELRSPDPSIAIRLGYVHWSITYVFSGQVLPSTTPEAILKRQTFLLGFNDEKKPLSDGVLTVESGKPSSQVSTLSEQQIVSPQESTQALVTERENLLARLATLSRTAE